MKKFLLSFIIALLVCCFVVFGYLIFSNKKENPQSTYKYAIIFYPDKKTSIEGYVEKSYLLGDEAYITIDGETYYTNMVNCLIIEKKDLNVVKEDKDESK